MTEDDPMKGKPAAIPILEEVVIPGELFAGEPTAEVLQEITPELENLIDEIIDRTIQDTLDQIVDSVRENLRIHLRNRLPALIAAARDASPSAPHEND